MKVTTIAIDLAKNVFQVLGMTAEAKKSTKTTKTPRIVR